MSALNFSKFIRSVLGAIAVLALSAGLAVTHATSIHYVLSFPDSSSNVAPPTASFDYDASSPSPFSNFVVMWNALALDFTSAANGFHFRTDQVGVGFDETCTNTVSDAFELLSRAACMTPQLDQS